MNAGKLVTSMTPVRLRFFLSHHSDNEIELVEVAGSQGTRRSVQNNASFCGGRSHPSVRGIAGVIALPAILVPSVGGAVADIVRAVRDLGLRFRWSSSWSEARV